MYFLQRSKNGFIQQEGNDHKEVQDGKQEKEHGTFTAKPRKETIFSPQELRSSAVSLGDNVLAHVTPSKPSTPECSCCSQPESLVPSQKEAFQQEVLWNSTSYMDEARWLRQEPSSSTIDRWAIFLVKDTIKQYNYLEFMLSPELLHFFLPVQSYCVLTVDERARVALGCKMIQHCPCIGSIASGKDVTNKHGIPTSH